MATMTVTVRGRIRASARGQGKGQPGSGGVRLPLELGKGLSEHSASCPGMIPEPHSPHVLSSQEGLRTLFEMVLPFVSSEFVVGW